MIVMAALYLVVFIGVAYLTRAKALRIAGAMCGSAVFGLIAVVAAVQGERQGWWRAPRAGFSHFWLLLWLVFAVSCAQVYLITWRTARSFGARGLALFVLAAAAVGPARDYWIAATFPEWITFSPGVVTVLAVATIYAMLVVVGHAIMRGVSGPARGDSLARSPSSVGKNNPK